MKYIPASYIELGSASEIEPLSLLICAERDTMLLGCAGGVLFLTGEWRGEVSQAADLSNFEGAILRDLEVDVDPLSSFHSPPGNYLPILSLARRTNGFYIGGAEAARGPFSPLRRSVQLSEIAPSTSDPTAVGFFRWRLVLPLAEQRCEVVRVEALAEHPK